MHRNSGMHRWRGTATTEVALIIAAVAGSAMRSAVVPLVASGEGPESGAFEGGVGPRGTIGLLLVSILLLLILLEVFGIITVVVVVIVVIVVVTAVVVTTATIVATTSTPGLLLRDLNGTSRRSRRPGG